MFCDEAAEIGDPIEALRQGLTATDEVDVMIRPEGGYQGSGAVAAHPRTCAPRILRADTAQHHRTGVVQPRWGLDGRDRRPVQGPHEPAAVDFVADPLSKHRPAVLRPARRAPQNLGCNQPLEPSFPDLLDEITSQTTPVEVLQHSRRLGGRCSVVSARLRPGPAPASCSGPAVPRPLRRGHTREPT